MIFIDVIVNAGVKPFKIIKIDGFQCPESAHRHAIEKSLNLTKNFEDFFVEQKHKTRTFVWNKIVN